MRNNRQKATTRGHWYVYTCVLIDETGEWIYKDIHIFAYSRKEGAFALKQDIPDIYIDWITKLPHKKGKK